MVLGQQREENRRRAGRQVVDAAEAQRAEDRDEEDRRDERGIEKGGEDE